ncbi:CBASS cGAMP-activated phospholipase [Thalassobacillus hwangdonensis]|uniref:CBASS cGAMP-activated phospholipase n=1 Tax=Thalassobacillus hwangdonensis TaxID=546108 RepID=A0ABW3L4G1_9BACI
MKMLCIDGGGIRGVMPITILQAIEAEYGKPVGEVFDVIAGTSTGSIIAASVALKTDMGELLENYTAFGESIFKKQAKVGLFKSVYSDESLRELLQKAFGKLTLAEIEKPLLIPAVDITHGRPYIHRSNFTNEENDDLSIALWDAVLSSCSAPIYFPPNNVNNHFLSTDGGLWANNPSLVCITEGVHQFNTALEDIHILSLGTGKQNIDFSVKKEKYWGLRHWLPFQLPTMKVTPKLLDLALNLSSESVSYHCQLLLKDHYLRINEELGKEVPFDDVTSTEVLIELGKKVYEQNKQDILTFLQ